MLHGLKKIRNKIILGGFLGTGLLSGELNIVLGVLVYGSLIFLCLKQIGLPVILKFIQFEHKKE